jgi:hypothetical protein
MCLGLLFVAASSAHADDEQFMVRFSAGGEVLVKWWSLDDGCDILLVEDLSFRWRGEGGVVMFTSYSITDDVWLADGQTLRFGSHLNDAVTGESQTSRITCLNGRIKTDGQLQDEMRRR